MSHETARQQELLARQDVRARMVTDAIDASLSREEMGAGHVKGALVA